MGTFTLTGTYRLPDGSTAHSGTARVSPEPSPIVDAAGSVIMDGGVSTALTSGAFSFTLQSAPEAAAYTLSVNVVSGPDYSVRFAAPDAGTTLDLSDLVATADVVVPDTVAEMDAAVAAVIGYDGQTDTALQSTLEDRFSPHFTSNAYPQTWITNFASGHGYTANAGGSSNLNDTSDYVLGSQAVTVTTDGAASAKTVKKTGLTAMNATGKHPKLWLKVDDQTHLAGIQLYLGDTNLANFFKWEMKSSASQKWITDGDWVVVTLPWGDATTTGTPTRASITDVQLRVVDDAAGTVTAHYNGVALESDASTPYPTGVVSVTFDDAYASTYTEGRAYMDKYGYPGTAYVIQEYVGGAGRMTLAQLQALEKYSGWEVGGHASTAAVHSARFTSLTADELATEFRDIRAWLRDNGFSGDTIAYPGGQYNNTVLAEAEKYHFSGARLVFQQPETLPPARRAKIRSGGYVTNATAVATITAAIDAAYTNGHWLVLTFHDLVTTTSVSTEYSIANFQTVIDYIATKGIPVRTVGNVLRSL